MTPLPHAEPPMDTPDPANAGTPGTIRVVIADDHAVVRRGLRQVLDAEEGFEVVAEASDLDGARRYVRGHHPDVLVLDLNMPGGSSLDGIPEIRAECPGTQIVVLTMQDEPAYARHALGAGALGYVLKESAESELVEAIQQDLNGASKDAHNMAWRFSRVPFIPRSTGWRAAAGSRVNGASRKTTGVQSSIALARRENAS